MKPNCHKCKFFYITYDKYTPYGCKQYGIKAAQIPSMVVKKANNGQECIGFEAKKTAANEKSKDFNDPKLW